GSTAQPLALKILSASTICGAAWRKIEAPSELTPLTCPKGRFLPARLSPPVAREKPQEGFARPRLQESECGPRLASTDSFPPSHHRDKSGGRDARPACRSVCHDPFFSSPATR